MSDMMKDCEATIGRLIDKQTTAFISSVDPDGFPNTKAMLSPRKRIGIQTFYFTTNTSSMRSAQYRENPKACIYFCDKRYFRGVMLIGTAEILEDTKSREMIWREGDTMYYCVLKITVTKGRYYSNFHSETFAVPAVKPITPE